MRALARLDYGWFVVATLSVTETVSWGIIYYGFPVMLRPMETDQGSYHVHVHWKTSRRGQASSPCEAHR